MKRISTRTKLFYGFGFSAQGIKDALFQVFLFFYFSQVLGLDAALTGAATIIALIFDAVSDPFVGILSDKWQSKKWGRRHPFMFASAIPLGVFIWLLFLPPADLGQMGLFWWLTIFTILVRLSLTLFQVPGMSLGAELSEDYEERTSITSYRIMFGAFVSTIIIILGFTVFFVPAEPGARGLFNIAAYSKFALFCGVIIVISILISTWGTRDSIPNLPQASTAQQRLTFFQLISNLSVAFKMKSYRMLVFFIMVIYIGVGVGTVFTTYFMTYYFELTEQEMAVLPIGSGIGGFLALFIAPVLSRKLDKKRAILYSTILFSLCFSMPYNLRLLGLFPENGAPTLVLSYLLTVVFGYLFLWVVLSVSSSMMADVVDEYELQSGNREEGLFFSSMSFAYKCTVGLGYFLAGILLNWIDFPKQAVVEAVPAAAVEGLGWVGGPILLTFYCSAIGFMLFYPITKKRYQEIRQLLDARK